MSVRARRGLVRGTLLAALGVVVASFGFAGAAQAQVTHAPVDLQIFRSAMDSKGFITLNSSAVLGQGDFSFGLVTTYSRRPLQLSGGQTFGMPAQGNSLTVDNLVTPSLQAAVGFTKLPHLGIELGIILPMSVLSGHATPSEPGAPGMPDSAKDYSFTNQGLGDLEVHPKFRFLNATRGGLGVAVIPSVIFGTGDKNGFLGGCATQMRRNPRPCFVCHEPGDPHLSQCR